MIDPHPTARALVEAWFSEGIEIGQAGRELDRLATRIALALTVAHDAGRREGREEAALLHCRACDKLTTVIEAHSRRFNEGRCGKCNGALTLRQLPLDDAARGEEPSE